MKVTTLTTVAVLFLYLQASAQLKIGVKGGLNLSDLFVPSDLEEIISPPPTHIDAHPSPGQMSYFHAGITTNQRIGKHWAASADLIFSIKGFQNNVPFNTLDPSDEFVLSLHYLALPIMFYYVPDEKIQLGAGLEAGYQIDAVGKINNERTDFTSLYDKNLEFSLNAGFRFLVTERFFVDGRYQWGLTSISDITLTDQDGEPLESGSLKNRVIQLSLGYFFIY